MEGGRIVIILAGAAFIGAGYYSYSDAASFLESGHQAEGRVVRVLWGDSSGMIFNERRTDSVHTRHTRDQLAKLEVRYNAGGGSHTVLSKTASRSYGRYEPGDRISVLYDPENPGDGRVAGGGGSMLGIVLMVAGAIAILGGLFGTTVPARQGGGYGPPPPGV